MAFTFVVFAAVLAYANAGFIAGPAAYSAAPAVSNAYLHQAAAPAVAVAAHASPVAIHDPAYGSSHQSVLRSLGGSHAVSHYTKAVDSAFSTVRKYDTRITNDAVTVAHAPVVSTYAAQAPIAVAHHAAPVVSTYAAQAPIAVAHHAAPIVSTYAAQAPVAVAHHAAPVVSSYAAHAPLVSAPVVAKTAAVAYSPAAVASHVTFSGLGTSYAW